MITAYVNGTILLAQGFARSAMSSSQLLNTTEYLEPITTSNSNDEEEETSTNVSLTSSEAWTSPTSDLTTPHVKIHGETTTGEGTSVFPDVSTVLGSTGEYSFVVHLYIVILTGKMIKLYALAIPQNP